MTNNISISMSGGNLYYSYQLHFQNAIHNLEEVIREERLLKRIQKSKSKPARLNGKPSRLVFERLMV